MKRLRQLGIRQRITGGSLVIAILISIAAGIVIYSQVQGIVTKGQDEVLRSVESPYINGINTGEDVDSPGRSQLVRVIGPGQVTHIDTLPDALTDRPESLEREGTRSVPTHRGSYLVRVVYVHADSGTWQVIAAMKDDDQVSLLNQLAWLLVLTIAGINVAFGASSWLIGGAALGPVTRLRRSAAELMKRPGAELLPVGAAADEISDLARTLNQLIGQLRASAEREKQIVSDASHEFRTPLAIMTTQLELAQAEASSLPQMQTDVAAAQKTLTRLTALATSLLELSRIDAQADPGRSTLGELAGELADAADRGRARVGHRDIRIDFASDIRPDRESDAIAVAVPDFGRACDNLVGNALAALEGSGTIDLSLAATDEGAVLRVVDDAGGMDPAFVDRAFERFSRGEISRGGSSGGSGAGLGLAIVDGVARNSGGSVRLDNRPGQGLAVEVLFGRAAAGAAPDRAADSGD